MNWVFGIRFLGLPGSVYSLILPGLGRADNQRKIEFGPPKGSKTRSAYSPSGGRAGWASRPRSRIKETRKQGTRNGRNGLRKARGLLADCWREVVKHERKRSR